MLTRKLVIHTRKWIIHTRKRGIHTREWVINTKGVSFSYMKITHTCMNNPLFEGIRKKARGGNLWVRGEHFGSEIWCVPWTAYFKMCPFLCAFLCACFWFKWWIVNHSNARKWVVHIPANALFIYQGMIYSYLNELFIYNEMSYSYREMSFSYEVFRQESEDFSYQEMSYS